MMFGFDGYRHKSLRGFNGAMPILFDFKGVNLSCAIFNGPEPILFGFKGVKYAFLCFRAVNCIGRL